MVRPGMERIREKPRPRLLDLVFVFDTTGSMSNKIDGLVHCMDELVSQLGKMRLDWRIAVVPFGDLTVPGDRIVEDLPFIRTVSDASRQLRTMPRFNGGGNLGESSAEAMLAACRKHYRDGAVKTLVLITDEPALGSEQSLTAVDNALAEIDAACFTVAPDGYPYFERWAINHGGEWTPVGPVVDTAAILALFRSLISRMVDVVDAVHRLGKGSVRSYVALNAGMTDPRA